MSVSREDLLHAATDLENDAFLELLKKHNSRDDPFDVNELLVTLDKKHLEELWSGLGAKFTGIIMSIDMQNTESHQEQELDEASVFLQGVVTFAMATVTQAEPFVPQPLYETAVILHGVLLTLPEQHCKLKKSIAKLFETWWLNNLEGKDDVATQTIMYMLQRSIDPQATLADVKRVYQLREILNLINLENESSADLKMLLQTAAVSSTYLKCDDGRRFLSFLFGLNPAFIETMHKTIKNHIPNCPKSSMTWYGEVYFRVWRVSMGTTLIKIEESCIQDFMFHAVHTQKNLAALLRKLLGYFHKQKKQQGVDEMLLRLYEPIIWRSLTVANGLVRANAAALLVDAFPLQNPEAGLEEVDQLAQRQFHTLNQLLMDPYPVVRVIAVEGTCKICNLYWELIPGPIIKNFLTRLVQEMAWDSASADVRVAVLKGLMHLLDNFLSHPILKTLLPEFKNLFHDTSERVRVAYVELLLKAKGIKAIKFWHLIPLDHLLARLEVDSPPVVRRIVSLLFNSYMPLEKEPEVQVTRCVNMVTGNPGAARQFYQHAVAHLSLANAAKFLLTVCKCVLQAVKKKLRENAAAENGVERDFLESYEATDESSQSDAPAAASTDDTTESSQSSLDVGDNSLSVDDVDVMCGLLETVVILWTGITPKLNAQSNKELKQTLQTKFSQALPQFFRAFQDMRVVSALIMLAGFMPPNMVPTLSRSMLSKLKGLDPENANPDQYGTMLESMCKWGKVNDVLELVSEWLNAGLLHGGTPTAKNRKAGRVVVFVDPVEPQPMLALDYLSYMVRQAVCREILLSGNTNLREVTSQLQAVTKCIEKRLLSNEALDEHTTDDFLLKAFQMYLRLEVLQHDGENRNHNAITVYEALLTWADMELLSMLKKKKKPQKKHRRLLTHQDRTLLADATCATGTATVLGSDTDTMSGTLMSGTLMSQTMASQLTAGDTMSDTLLGGTKRSAGEGGLNEFAASLIQCLLQVASNMLLSGVGDHELASHLADFCLLVLQIDEHFQFLAQTSQLMYQITELSLSWGAEDDEGLGSQGDIIPEMLHKVIQMLATLAKTKKDQAERILPTVKPILGELFSTYYRHHSLNQTVNKNIMASVMGAVVTDITDVVKQDNNFEARESVNELPTLCVFFLGILGRRTSLLSLFLDELKACIDSGAVVDIEGLLGATHILFALSKGKNRRGEMKDCVMSLEKQCDEYSIPVDTLENSPVRDMVTNCKTLIRNCMTRLGMAT